MTQAIKAPHLLWLCHVILLPPAIPRQVLLSFCVRQEDLRFRMEVLPGASREVDTPPTPTSPLSIPPPWKHQMSFYPGHLSPKTQEGSQARVCRGGRGSYPGRPPHPLPWLDLGELNRAAPDTPALGPETRVSTQTPQTTGTRL